MNKETVESIINIIDTEINLINQIEEKTWFELGKERSLLELNVKLWKIYFNNKPE